MFQRASRLKANANVHIKDHPMSTAQNSTLKSGTVLENKWIIIELIGKGAMGEVYRAHQTNLKRDVAIKIISNDILAEIEEDPEELSIAYGRFQREVQTMAQVSHSNILTIYDYGEIVAEGDSVETGMAFIVMEYIPGNSLRFTLAEDGLDDEPELYGNWIKKYFMPILDGVEVLHHHKIIHRDLKPENIFMDGEVPKIADFGLARSYQMKAVTSSLEMLGTLAYMSPEQCSDFKTADFTTDIYALGKMLFEAANGTLTEKILPFKSVKIEKPQSPFLEKMSLIIEKATAESPSSRYQSITELRHDLQSALPLATVEKKPEGNNQVKIDRSQKDSLMAGKRLMAGVIIAILSVAGMAVYHLIGYLKSPPESDNASYAFQTDLSEVSQPVVIRENDELKQGIVGRDGTRMVLTGKTGLKKGSPLFYMDEHTITFFTFVEFLNDMGDKLTVKNGVVRHGESIVFYLEGDGKGGAITYKHNKFHLNNQSIGDKPVVRVTYHGARLFAGTYGKELLTDAEWQFAYNFHRQKAEEKNNQLVERPSVPSSSGMMHHSVAPALTTKKKTVVLDDMGHKVKEWVRILQQGNLGTSDPAEDKYESGIMDAERAEKNEAPLKRLPWEGFEDVGFRTKVTVVRD